MSNFWTYLIAGLVFIPILFITVCVLVNSMPLPKWGEDGDDGEEYEKYNPADWSKWKDED